MARPTTSWLVPSQLQLATLTADARAQGHMLPQGFVDRVKNVGYYWLGRKLRDKIFCGLQNRFWCRPHLELS